MLILCVHILQTIMAGPGQSQSYNSWLNHNSRMTLSEWSFQKETKQYFPLMTANWEFEENIIVLHLQHMYNLNTIS